MPIVEVWIAFGTAVLLTVGFGVCLLLDKRRSVWVDRRFPSTGRTNVLYGDFGQAGRTEHRMYSTERLYRAFRARKLPIGGALLYLTPCVIVADAELIEHVLSDEFVKVQPDVRGMRTFRRWWDAFEEAQFEKLLQVANEESQSVAMQLVAGDHTVQDVKAVSELFVVRTIARTIFGKRWNEGQPLPLANAEAKRPPHVLWSVLTGAFPSIRRLISFLYLDDPSLLEEFVHSLEDDCTSKPYFLQYLQTMESKAGVPNRLAFSAMKVLLQELVQNVLHIAGSTMIACLFELARQPELQASLHDELKHAGDAMVDRLDNVISETLRKYPPVDEISFVSGANNRLPGCVLVVPRNTRVTVPVYAVHRDAEHYPDPSRFDPDRPMFHSRLYRPLGDEPHPVGATFGTLLVRVALTSILKRCRVRLTPESPSRLEMCPTLALPYPRDKIKLLIEAA